MSLVKYGGGIIQMSGSIAGNTFGRNRYGNYVRAKTKPVNPRTQLQTDIREAVQVLTARWANTVTSAQRTAWNLYADSVSMKNKLGEVIKLSGFNHYIRSNVQPLRAGLTPIDAGPTQFELPETDATFAVTMSLATQQMTVTFDDTMPWCTEAGGRMFIEQGQPQNPQRNFFGGPWKYAGVLSGVDPGGIASPQVAPVVFAVALGQHVWIYARILRADGRLSEIFRAECFCAA
jgi:hypothetical protein